MDLFDVLDDHRYGSLHLHTDEATGLRAIVALHDLTLGPGLGGTRCIPYPTSNAALLDAIRLARGMCYNAALANLDHGGGKAVIMRPADGFHDRDAAMAAFGRFVDSLGGRYITTEDSGTSPHDMNTIRAHTRYVVGVSPEHGGSGDPSPWTARGVLRGIEACVQRVLERSDLDGLRVAIQGVGHVGFHLAALLHERGARLFVADVADDAVARCVDEFGATAVATEEIVRTECDVFSPCALGAVIDDESLPTLRCRIVAGAANNVLAEARHGDALAARHIAYAPDYAINAGGLISVADEWAGYDRSRVVSRVDAIGETIGEILERSGAENLPTHAVADAMAEARIYPGEP